MKRVASLLFVLFSVFFLFCVSCNADAVSRRETVQVKVFYSRTCDECLSVVAWLEKKYSNVLCFSMYDIDDVENFSYMIELEEKADLSESSRMSLFFSDAVFQGKEQIYEELPVYLENVSVSQNVHSFDVEKETLPDNNKIVAGRVERFTYSAVLLAGVADGVNPCAFSTIIFFSTFLLSFLKGKRAVVFSAGFIFLFVSFFTYLLLGFGLFYVLRHSQYFWCLSNVLKLLFSIMTFAFALLSFADAIKAVQGKNKFVLRLPHKLKIYIAKIVRHEFVTKNIYIAAGLLGFIVTLAESVCTGQMYAPTIYLVLRSGTITSRAIMMLFLYNVMFILPLAGVLIFTVIIGNSLKVVSLSRKNLIVGKITLAVVFLCVGMLILIV